MRREGRGRAIYLGAVPRNPEAAARLYRQLLPGLGGRRTRCLRVKLEAGGRRYEFLLNDSAAPCPLDRPLKDLISGAPIGEIPAYGVALVACRAE